MEDRNENIIYIEISEATEDYRDQIVFDPAKDARKLPEKVQQALFDHTVRELRSRRGQSFPDMETVNQLTRKSCAGGDVYSLSSKESDCIVLYLHGGAWIGEIDALQVSFCDKLVDLLNAEVCMPLYPLAPEFSAADDYAMLKNVYLDLLNKEKPILIMGDSAGATMALGLVLDLKAEDITLPHKVVVIAPGADIGSDNKEIMEYQKKDGFLPWLFCRECGRLWAGDKNIKDWEISPLYGDYNGFPDTLMYVGTSDILYPDDMKLFEKMASSDMKVRLIQGNGFWHTYPLYPIEEQRMLLGILKDFCSR